MLGEWRWLRHAAIFLGISSVAVALDGLLDIAWFMLSQPRWGTREGWLLAIAVGAALYLHLIHASSLSLRRAAQIACLVPALLGGAGYWLVERNTTRNVNRIDADLLIYPPGMRLRAAAPAADYFKTAAALRNAADKKRQAVQADEADQEND